MAIHHLRLKEFTAADLMETECGIVVVPVRRPTDDFILSFKTWVGHSPIQCVEAIRDSNCKLCQHEWENLK